MTTFRHLTMPKARGQRVAPKGVQGLITWLSFSGFATLERSQSCDELSVYTLRPGPYAHNLFVEGEAPTEDPAFTEMVITVGGPQRELVWEDKVHAVYFSIDLRGALFPGLLETLEERLSGIRAIRRETLRARER